ncbi:MAG: polysaccharide pyruvyl transferase family protein [Clostridia bacterium]|nr:polysaccharide pyruvyl transferase family protein [Clostridia bacterium]
MIGILTFNRAINYGAVLQSFALKESLSKYNSCEIINYKNDLIEKAYDFSKDIFLERMYKKITISKKISEFNSFISEISSKNIYDINTIHTIKHNKLVCGSDQVWNFNCSGNDTTYLLNGFENAKKYSYAASFGVSRLPEDQVEIFRDSLSEFKYISVREETGKKICREQLGLDAEVVVDPTLLLTKAEWKDKLNIQTKQKKYVLIYAFDNNDLIKKVAKKIAKVYGLSIYNLAISGRDFFGNKLFKNAGPQEWVSLFYNAIFVVTDSFHGTAFSINFNKPFYTFAKNDRKSRIVDILELMGLQDRLITCEEQVNTENIIDYKQVNKRLEEERQKSLAYIERIVND